MLLRNTWLTVTVLGALSACGGSSENAPETPVNVIPTAALTLGGTVATGTAIGGAPISIKCQSGNASATSTADGAYSVLIPSAAPPCMLQVTNPVDGSKLHGVATGSAASQVANITPLTEMSTARALHHEPAVFFAGFDPAVAASTLTSVNMKSAQADVSAVLNSAVDTSSIGDFSASPFKASTLAYPHAADGHNKVLDALNIKFNSAQLSQVVSALARTGRTEDVKRLLADLTAAPPVAHAGSAQSVITDTLVTLDASASSAAAGRTLHYAWVLSGKPAGSMATLALPDSAKPTFTADIAGDYVLTLVVSDGKSSSAPAAVTVSASAANAAPVASAGLAQNVVAGTLVKLDASGSSDANKDALTYHWTLTARPAGSGAALSSATSLQPVFTADVAGIYVASLTVNDGKLDSAVATVSITASVLNAAPVAHAGSAQNVVAGSRVTLNGSRSSDADGDMLSYAWSLTSRPAGSTASLQVPTSRYPAFTADAAGIYIASLIVSDGKLASTPSTVTITAARANVAPVANAGEEQTVSTKSVVRLSGAASSDANGDRLTYLWEITSKPRLSNAKLDDPTSVAPSFTADIGGYYGISLVVNDGLLSSAATRVLITSVSTAKPAPAGTGLIVHSLDTSNVLNESTMLASLTTSCQRRFLSMDQRPDGMLIAVGAGSLFELDVIDSVCIEKGRFRDMFTSFAIDANSQYWSTSLVPEGSGENAEYYLRKQDADGKISSSVLLSGAATLITGMDFHPNGDLLGIGYPKGYSLDNHWGLVRINTTTGVTTLIARLDVHPDGDIDIDQAGVIRGIANGEMLYISSSTGELLKKVAIPGHNANDRYGTVVFVK